MPKRQQQHQPKTEWNLFTSRKPNISADDVSINGSSFLNSLPEPLALCFWVSLLFLLVSIWSTKNWHILFCLHVLLLNHFGRLHALLCLFFLLSIAIKKNLSVFLLWMCVTFTVWQPLTRRIPMCTFRYFQDRIYGSYVHVKCNHSRATTPQKANSKVQFEQRAGKAVGRCALKMFV